jgi:competence protein ComFB
MNIHNITEDYVIRTVNDIFNEAEKSGKTPFCTCRQCRLDVACYVLNRMEPRYVVSGKGLAYTESEYKNDFQKNIDIVSSVNEAIEKVSRTKRPNFNHDRHDTNEQPEGPFFNLPSITGRLFNGNNFEPVSGLDLFLIMDGKHCEMINPGWQNPYNLSANTPGSFTFLPKPVPAVKAGEKRTFDFEITTKNMKYEPVHHYFKIEVTADPEYDDSVELLENFKAGDLYIFTEK